MQSNGVSLGSERCRHRLRSWICSCPVVLGQCLTKYQCFFELGFDWRTSQQQKLFHGLSASFCGLRLSAEIVRETCVAEVCAERIRRVRYAGCSEYIGELAQRGCESSCTTISVLSRNVVLRGKKAEQCGSVDVNHDFFIPMTNSR